MDTVTPLATQLAEFKTGFKQRVAPARVAMMETATAGLRATGIEHTSLRQGDPAPDLTLADTFGRLIRLADHWARGPLVIVFYRGGWCPYCNLELRAWQQQFEILRSKGASLVAISPQMPDNSLTTAEKNQLAFPVLSDSSLDASRAFGVAFVLPPELIDLYGSVGNELPLINGNGLWELPIPATYVIDQRGHIAYAHINADYRDRAEPSDVLAFVDKLRNGGEV